MDIVSIVVVLIVVGLLLWAINSLIPMDPTLRRIIHVVVIVAVVLWLLSVFVGVLPALRLRL